jgi:copper chaperone CopZ
MTKFGILKSKIENVLLESYKNDTFKNELKTFKKLVLENKNVSKIFYMYDELNSKKGLSESYSREYIHECVTLYENAVNKILPADLKKLNTWVKNVKSNNSYENIDNLFSTDVLTIESRIKSKNLITENLKKLPVIESKGIELPLSTMVSVANKTIKNYIDGLNESDKKEIIKLLSEDDKELTIKFDTLKENVVDKLKAMKNSSEDNSVKTRIDETLTKVISEKYDKLTYFKLKSLNENL